jgi:hypothetical protein
MSAKVCTFCKKKFWSKSAVKKYCSSTCAKKAASKRQRDNEQLCFSCKNACGGCNWSRDFSPVIGWDATPSIVKDKEGYIESYRISGCPEYIPLRNS